MNRSGRKDGRGVESTAPGAWPGRAGLRRVARPACAGAMLALAFAVLGCSTERDRNQTPLASDISFEERLERATQAMTRGRQLQDGGDMPGAEREYRAAVEALPDMGAAWNNLGVVLMAQDKTLDADRAFRAAMEHLPADPRPAINLGIMLIDRGHAGPAREAFLAALVREPNNIDALRGAFRADRALGNNDDQALARVSRALLIETEPAWREAFAYEKLRLEEVQRRRALEFR